MKQTKIVASVSDLRCEVDFIKQLYEAGVNVIRMNTAHATPEGLKKIIRNVRAVSPSLAILIDTKGPEVRTTGTDNPIDYKTGEKVTIIGNPDQDTAHDTICLSYPDICKDVKVGDDILFDDGELDMQVVANDGKQLTVEVLNDGKLGSHKSVNVPGEHIDLPALTEKDKRNILLAIEEDIDFIAHSFVRSKEDLMEVQRILDEHNSDIKIISKIENQEGVDNIDEILDHCYGIMVARGDLGIEIPAEKIPGIQRMIIKKCVFRKKPVIVATQMLHTMIKNPRPTRAEVSDIASAVFHNTDALMLSGETASGAYPIEAVKTMAKIAEQAEADRSLHAPKLDVDGANTNLRDFLCKAAIETTAKLDVKCILTDSGTGDDARTLAAYRGPHPVVAICKKEKLQRWLALSYGVIATYPKQDELERMFYNTVKDLYKQGMVTLDDKVTYLSGHMNIGISDKSAGVSMLEVNTVSEVFANYE
ncbi:MAG: pyruvate kinase [Prevotella sp.]|nr:pyruvate kinase [Prevotella sp.]MBR6192308.1 pyruvate kinase [Prevotella sp.]